MAIPIRGQLGSSALGSFGLGMWSSSAPFVPHTGRIHSTMTRDGVQSTLSRTSIRSSIRADTPRSTIE